ncbi:TPA: biopolymer transporter ExbD [Vibrio parahaemolyticus]
MFNKMALKLKPDVELDITPFLSLMVVLIPVLLISAKFTIFAEYTLHSGSSVPQEVKGANELTQPPFKILVSTDEISLYQGDKMLLSAPLKKIGTFSDSLDDVLSDKKISAPLVIDLMTDVSYQKIVDILDIANLHPDNFSAVSVTVSRG